MITAEMIEHMLEGFDPVSLKIREEDIPRCPECGGLLSPNLRMDHCFVDGASMRNSKRYQDFVSIEDENILFWELGVRR